MPNNEIDLANLFTQVGKALSQQKSELNQADTQNHDHGDNMVEIFKLIAQAAEQKQSSSQAKQLDYAAQLLQGKQSGSAQVYAKGLQQAAEQFKGSEITPANVLQLVQTLIGGGGTAGGGGALGAILSQLKGGAVDGAHGLEVEGSSEINTEDLLNAGMAFLAAKNAGDSNVEALIKAVVNDSAMGSSAHRAQSSELVMKTLIDVVGRMGKR